MGSFGLGVPLLHSRAQVFMHLGLKHFQRILCGSWVPWAPGLTDLPDSALMVVLEAWLRSNCYLLMVVLEAWLRSNCYLLLSAVWANVLAFLISFPPVKDNITEAPLSSVLSPLPRLGGSPWGLQPVWGGEAGLGRVA